MCSDSTAIAKGNKNCKEFAKSAVKSNSGAAGTVPNKAD
jgi:hypothetical protein